MNFLAERALPSDVAPEPMLELDGLTIERSGPQGNEKIVDSISLSLATGETIGIVGESGSGKSMTARAITGLLPPNFVASGEVRYEGRNLLGLSERQWRSVRGSEIGLILQDPFTMLNPLMRCRHLLDESFVGMSRMNRAERRRQVNMRLAEVGITDETVADRYPFQLSGGMRQRVAIAAALARDPKVLIADEPSTALDVATQRDILSLITRIQSTRGMGLVLITHDLRVAFSMCDRIHVLYAGSLLESAPSAQLEAEPLHPYSQGLLLSEPSPDHRVAELVAIPGMVPTPAEVEGICAFAPRCRWVASACREGSPPLVEVAPGRTSACLRLPEIRSEMLVISGRTSRRAPSHKSPRPSKALVTVQEVRKTFQNGTRSVTALSGVSIELGEGESVGLVGESGSGKSTLARILVGLDSVTSGNVTIAGVAANDWATLSSNDRRKLRSAVQIVFQDPYSSLNPMRTVGSALGEAVSIHNHEQSDRDEQVEELLRSVGLPVDYAKRKPVALSGGERQRVAIARSLAAKPRLLICDEPVSALDVSVQAQILNLLQTLRVEHGIAFLFITHDLSIVRQVTDYVYVLYRGAIVEFGPTDQVLGNPTNSYTAKLLESVPHGGRDWLLQQEIVVNNSEWSTAPGPPSVLRPTMKATPVRHTVTELGSVSRKRGS